MKKMTILGIGSSTNYNYLIIKKEEGFFEWLQELLVEGMGDLTADVLQYDDDGNKLKVLKFNDFHESYMNGKERAEFFMAIRKFLSL